MSGSLSAACFVAQSERDYHLVPHEADAGPGKGQQEACARLTLTSRSESAWLSDADDMAGVLGEGVGEAR